MLIKYNEKRNTEFRFHRWINFRMLLITLFVRAHFFLSPRTAFAQSYDKIISNNDKRSLAIRIWILFIFFSICIICFLAAGSISAAAAIVYVDTDGTGNYNCDGINDHIELNKALAYIDSTGGGTVYLRGANTYWIDATLEMGSNTILTGDPSACIKLVPNAGWDVQVPMIKNKNDVNKNITIKGFKINGNSESQSVSYGKGYYNMMYFVNCTDVTVTGMRLEWGTGDGLKIRNSPYNYTFLTDVKFTDNSVYKLGHDALYVLGMNGITVANNDVYTRTNSAFRLSSSGHAKIYNNVIHSEFSSSSNGPGIEIDKTSGIIGAHISENIEIYNNLFHTLYGSAIWITGEDADNIVRGKDVYIHHNIMYNVGQYPIDTGYSNAAITIGQFNNTRIENNVIDNGGHAGIKYYQYVNSYRMASKFTTTVKNNIIINCAKNVATGVWNYDSENHKFILNNNCIYWNTKGAYVGANIIRSGDIYVDPLFVSSATRDYHLKSTAGHYSSGKWIADTVSSLLIDAGYPTSAYNNEPSPNGGRINIGRYGNTAQASKSAYSSEVPNAGDTSPVANAGTDKTAIAGSAVMFDGSVSTDDQGIVLYSWDFNYADGITSDATGVTATKIYTTAGTYTVTLTVTDTIGQRSTDTLQVVVSTPTSIPAGTVSYVPVYDNRLREASPTTALPTNSYIDVGRTTANFRDVMMFDLSSYKTTDTISKATLLLYWYYPAGAIRNSDTLVEIYRPIQWDPQYVTWNTRMSGIPWTTPGGSWFDKNGVSQGATPYASLTFTGSKVPDNKYYEFDVTQLVQEYVSGKHKNTGFFLKAKTEGNNYIAFYSSDWSNSAQRPKLTVTTGASAVDNPPVANAGADKNATADYVVIFDASLSTDDKGIASYSWDFDASNGITSQASGVSVTHTYTSPGTYTVTLTVTDTAGQKSADTLQVVVSSPIIIPAGTVSYVPDYDNRLKESSATSVFSTITYLDIGKLGTTSYRDVMWFDLSAYSSKDTISQATLSLYWYYPAGATRTSDTVVEVYRPAKEWDSQYVTWASRILGVLWDTPGGEWFDKNDNAQGTVPYASVTFPASTVPDNKYYDFDVTQLVQEYISGTYENTGFFLKARTESGNYIAFYSSEWSNPDQRPQLKVCLNDASDPITPPVIDNPPAADAGADKNATKDVAVTFDGSNSTDDNGIVSYSWDFGDGTAVASDVSPVHTYATAGTYTVTLTVTDTIGQTDSDTMEVVVSELTITTGSSVSYTAAYDNRLRQSSPTTVLSTSAYIDIGRLGTASYRDVMWFDLSGYNSTDTISKATLSLYWYYPAGATRASDTVVEIYRPVKWDPQYVTWNTRISDVPWTAAGGDWFDKKGVAQGNVPYASVTFPASTMPDNKYYDFDVTQIVQEYVSGKYENTGFFLKANTESGNYIAFYSADASDAAMRPKLTMTS
jgi:PKD repeat protein